MEILSDKNEIIFRKDYNGKPSYSLGLSKKNKDGEFINGYIKVNFRKGVDLNNKTKIKIKNGWLDFYKDEDKTVPTLFIDEFVIVSERTEEHKSEEVYSSNPFEDFNERIKSEIGQQIEISPDDLPF